MKKKLYTIKGTVLLFSLLFLSSCRSTDTENTLVDSGSSAVNFNLLGTEFSNLSSSSSASINKNIVPEQAVQTHSVLVTPSTFMSVKLSSVVDGVKPLAIAASGMNPVAAVAVSGNSLGPGLKFRVIAYRQSNGNYHTHQDYTIGQTALPMMLDNGAAYNIVVYSYGVTSLPSISSGEMSNISSSTVNYDDTNRDFMYQKLVFTPANYTNNTLNITLRHKVAQITTIVNSGNLGNITNITGGVLTPHYSNGVITLSSGAMSGRTTTTSGMSLNFSGLNTTIVTADPVFVNTNTSGSATGGFAANITIDGTPRAISFPNTFKITPENKSNLTINLMKCGAYIGPNTNIANYKEFMCHNLGADTRADAFIPAAAIHGAKYQWGAKTDEGGRYINQFTDQNSPTLTGWYPIPLPSGAWVDTRKTGRDPCPTGYRVPTQAQWQAVIDNNDLEQVGSWANDGNYTTALYVRTKISQQRTLMLPATGGRGAIGQLFSRGNIGGYWASGEGNSMGRGFTFTLVENTVGIVYRAFGYPVRCIEEY